MYLQIEVGVFLKITKLHITVLSISSKITKIKVCKMLFMFIQPNQQRTPKCTTCLQDFEHIPGIPGH